MPLPDSGPQWFERLQGGIWRISATESPGPFLGLLWPSFIEVRERRCAVSVVNDPMGIDGGLTGSGCLANVITIFGELTSYQTCAIRMSWSKTRRGSAEQGGDP